MGEELTAEQWHVLDNLLHNWPYSTSLIRAWADEAMQECEVLGYTAAGRITDEGKVALMIQNVTGNPKNKVRKAG